MTKLEVEIQAVVERAIKEQLFPGCVVGAANGYGQRLVCAFGRHTYAPHSPKITKQSIFDIASITKSIPVSSLALKMVELGRLDPDDKITNYIPEFNNSYRDHLHVWHLITQTIDCNYRLSSFKDKPPEILLNKVLTGEFNSPPGTKLVHTNAAIILLGLVIERITGMSIADLGNKYFFEPLDMRQTTFDTNRFDKGRFVPTEIDPWRGRVIQGEVHDESSFILLGRGYPAAAGLFSTAPDILTFMGMLTNNGLGDDCQIFFPETIRLMYTNQLHNIGDRFSMGWEINQPEYMGQFVTPNTFGRTGFTGCVVICNPVLRLTLVILTNYHFPKRKYVWEALYQFRREVANILFDPTTGYDKNLAKS